MSGEYKKWYQKIDIDNACLVSSVVLGKYLINILYVYMSLYRYIMCIDHPDTVLLVISYQYEWLLIADLPDTAYPCTITLSIILSFALN
jgi:hypothetical protein